MSECVIAGMGGGIKLQSGTVTVSSATINVNLGAKPKIVFFCYLGAHTGFASGETEAKIMVASALEFFAHITADGFAIRAYNTYSSTGNCDLNYTAIF